MPSDLARIAERELQSFERLTADISTRFGYLPADELIGAVEDTLRRIVEVLDVDRSTVFELSDNRQRADATHFWARSGIPPIGSVEARTMEWYFGHLRAGRIIRVADIDRELPPEASAERAYAQQTGMKSNLTVPVSIGGRLVCALAVGTFRRYRDWPDPLVDRVKLIAEIIGAALQRRRHDLALRASLDEIERLNRRLSAENLYLKEEIKSAHDFDEIIGNSEALRLALGRVEQVAPTGTSVLLLGESGTGKELFARAIHDRSARRQQSLVGVNCAALPPGLIESELLGHERGAFTGAVGLRQGRFEIADGGTLFLDEVGDLPLELQGRLLRVLQEGAFERVGSSRTMQVDVRLIAATNRDLQAMAADGRFRADLYYRLSVFPIVLPPLRERPDDIPSLVWFFVTKHQRRLGHRVERVPRVAMEALQRYAWPGNVRELENVVERALIRSSGEVLALDEGFSGPRRRGAALRTGDRTLAAVERAHIETVLADCGWRINGPGHAAEQLGLHPNTLRFRMKKLGITRPKR